MTLEGELTLLDPFTHTKQDREKIENFDFLTESSITESEKVMIIETFCTLVTVTGKYLEKEAFKEVLKNIDVIREIIRLNNHYIFYKHLIQLDQSKGKFDFLFLRFP